MDKIAILKEKLCDHEKRFDNHEISSILEIFSLIRQIQVKTNELNGIINDEIKNIGEKYFQIAKYFQSINNEILMIKYYKLAYKKFNSNSMFELGEYFKEKKNISLMLECFIKASQLQNIKSFEVLGDYYWNEKKFIDSVKYYLDGINCDSQLLANSKITLRLGIYYETVNINHKLSVKYYELSTRENNSTAMINLGLYYRNQKNYLLMKEYWLMAFNNDNMEAANYLGLYYQNVEIDYDMMKMYYLAGIDNSNSNVNCINNLAFYYKNVEKDFELMKSFYIMGCNNHSQISMYELGHYYQYIEINYKLMKYYYKMAISYNNQEAMYHYAQYFKSLKNKRKMKKYLFMASELNHYPSICELLKISNVDNKVNEATETIDKVFDVNSNENNELSSVNIIDGDENKNEVKFRLFDINSNIDSNDCDIDDNNIDDDILIQLRNISKKKWIKLNLYFPDLTAILDNYKKAIAKCEHKLSNEINEFSNKYLELGKYFYSQKNYDMMKKYYQLSIDLNSNLYSIIYFGEYYQYVEINPKMMFDYYNIGLMKSSNIALSNIYNYYYNFEKNGNYGLDIFFNKKKITNANLKLYEYLIKSKISNYLVNNKIKEIENNYEQIKNFIKNKEFSLKHNICDKCDKCKKINTNVILSQDMENTLCLECYEFKYF